MKFISGAFIPLFLVFALVQVNDPDPIIWISAYLLMAGLSLASLRGKLHPTIILLTMVIYAGFMIRLWPGMSIWLSSEKPSLIFDDIAKMQNIYIEEAREFFGLFICLLALFNFYWLAKKEIKTV